MWTVILAIIAVIAGAVWLYCAAVVSGRADDAMSASWQRWQREHPGQVAEPEDPKAA